MPLYRKWVAGFRSLTQRLASKHRGTHVGFADPSLLKTANVSPPGFLKGVGLEGSNVGGPK